jgi:hypothetical protein
MRLVLRLADRLLQSAVAVMPAHRRDWAEGMRAELAAIEDPGSALAFALGGLWTACQQRMSPMRIMLFTARQAVAAVSLLTAAAHAFLPVNMAAVAIDLRRHGLDGWAGRFALFKGQTATEALASVLAIPLWHAAAMMLLAASFATAAWFLARWNPKALMIAVTAGLVLHTVNTLALLASGPTPFLMNPTAAWLDYTALTLLLAAGLAFWALGRRTTPKPRPA